MGQLDFLDPFLCTLFIYGSAFGIAYVLKKLMALALGKKYPSIQWWLAELITSLQMCTIVFQNGIMLKAYGVYYGFGPAVFIVLSFASFINQGYFTHILVHVENAYNGKNKWTTVIATFAAQFIGASWAITAAAYTWYYATGLFTTHRQIMDEMNPCKFNPIDFSLLFTVELCSTALLRLIIGLSAKYNNAKLHRFTVPATVSILLCNSLLTAGVGGLNPITSYARLGVCPGWKNVEFLLIFFVGTTVGWIIGKVVSDGVISYREEKKKARREAAKEDQKKKQLKKKEKGKKEKVN